MRLISAQLEAYVTDGRWLQWAGHANAMMQRLAEGLGGLGVRCLNEPEVNIVFFEERDEVADGLRAAGVDFYAIRAGVHRFVTSFRTTPEEVDEVLRRYRAVRAAHG